LSEFSCTGIFQKREADWSVSVPACRERRFGANKYFSFILAEICRARFFALARSRQAGRLRSSPLRVFLDFQKSEKFQFYKSVLPKLAVVCLSFCLLLLTNCKSETVNQPTAPTREITDDLGRRVRLPERVTSAVSLAPNLTEIAFAVGAGERLVGVTSFCDYPAEAKKIRRIGDTLAPNIENIIALKPQIVLVSTASQMENFTATLDRQGIAYFVTNPNSLDDIYKSVYQIGEIFRREDRAYQMVDELKKRVADIEARTASAADVKVFVQIDKNSLYTVGRDSFITDLINRAGGESLTKDIATAYPKISKETALALNPEQIILSESDNNREPNEVFINSPAMENGKVFHIEADLLSRPGPRIVDGLERLARALHPENFE
jgi:iron complex transport system substrate-binding protein